MARDPDHSSARAALLCFGHAQKITVLSEMFRMKSLERSNTLRGPVGLHLSERSFRLMSAGEPPPNVFVVCQPALVGLIVAHAD